ncbi:MAG: hypothetical protein WCL32_01595 [Planctomycetota bacterium]
MRFAWAVFGILIAFAPAQAGIYNTTEIDELRLSSDVSQFRETLNKVRSIGFDKVDFDNLLRKRYFLNDALGGAKPPVDLTLEQKLDYSAVLIRRKKYQQAIDFLTPLTRQYPDMFLFESHLAMAYWGIGQQTRAVEILSQALSKQGWPATFGDMNDTQRTFISDAMGWNEGLFDFYRRSEMYLLKLMKQRLAEPSGAYETVDALFDDGKTPAKTIRFLNDQGKFEPGRIAPAELKKLPPAALEYVEQLCLWMPEDLRLYWLLGEMANAQWTPELLADSKKRDLAVGNLKAANKIFDELVYDFKIRVNDLRERRQVLHDFIQTVEAPRPTIDEFETELIKKATPPEATMPTRTLLITFAAGLTVGIFAVWQFQEIRRRRRG